MCLCEERKLLPIIIMAVKIGGASTFYFPSLNFTIHHTYIIFIHIYDGMSLMASNTTLVKAKIVYSMELVEELGFPKGVLPLKDLVVGETGFVWMKQKAPSEHFFEGSKTLLSYAVEVEKFKI
ncbi:hypothetical protein RJT34_15058 [Clitoria ternatea]|uniref:Uncharacterized protein n=1 Tax=Clitoria ternatea TaxID=43366 RepID=A0AAN9JU29_CLITE